MKVHHVAQRSPEWRALKLGKVGGSRSADLLATIKSGEAAARRNLRMQLVLERITGRGQENEFLSQAMKDGIEREPRAVAMYVAETGNEVHHVGFVEHDELRAGCSPDGVIGDFEGILEIKCPLPATHLTSLRTGLVPDEYVRQCVHNLWITGAQWCDWFSYHPDFPDSLQTRLVRIRRDERVIANYEAQVRKFLAEVDLEVAAIKTMVDSADQWRQSLGATI